MISDQTKAQCEEKWASFSFVARSYDPRFSNRYFDELFGIATSKINICKINDENLTLVRKSLKDSKDLSDQDVSLIVSALIESNKTRKIAVVITDDVSLANALKEIYNAGSIVLKEGSFVTNMMTSISVYIYTSCLHECCLLSTEEQMSVLEYLRNKDMNRLIRLNYGKRRIKQAFINETIRRLVKAAEIKKQVLS